MRVAASRLSARNPLGASATEVLLAQRTVQLPSFCRARRVRERWDIASMGRAPTTTSARALENRPNQRGDVVGAVLVVGVRVDDDVGSAREARFEADPERLGQPEVPAQANDVVDAGGARDLDRAILAAVVHDQPLDGREALDAARQRPQRDGQRLLFVVAGDLDDQSHWIAFVPFLAWRERRPEPLPSRMALRRRPLRGPAPLIARAPSSPGLGVRPADAQRRRRARRAGRASD